MRRRVLASVVLAVCTVTLAISTPHQDAAVELIKTQAISAPAVIDVPPAYTGPTHESLAVTLTRVVEEKHNQDLTAFYAEMQRQEAERAAWVAAHPRTYQTQAPEAPQVSYDAGSMEAIIADVFGPYAAKAIRIATCESGLNPNARNRSGASGLFQVMMPMHADLFDKPSDVFDPYANTRAAFSLSNGGTSWSAWVCRG